MVETKIEINDAQIFGEEMPRKLRQLDLSVNLAKKYDLDGKGLWSYRKTFKRFEKYTRDFDNSVLSRPAIAQYITNSIYPNQDNLFDRSPALPTYSSIENGKDDICDFTNDNMFGINLPPSAKESI